MVETKWISNGVHTLSCKMGMTKRCSSENYRGNIKQIETMCRSTGKKNMKIGSVLLQEQQTPQVAKDAWEPIFCQKRIP